MESIGMGRDADRRGRRPSMGDTVVPMEMSSRRTTASVYQQLDADRRPPRFSVWKFLVIGLMLVVGVFVILVYANQSSYTCTSPQTARINPPVVHSLDTLRWDPRNHQVLADVIGNNSAAVDTTGCRHYATFDWDNTAALFDLQENTLLCQLDNLEFHVSATKFAALLSQDVPYGHECAGAGCSTEAAIKAMTAKVAADYSTLYHQYTGFGAGGTMTLAQVTQTDTYKYFTARFTWLYYAVSATYGDTVGYSWILTFGGNQSIASYTDMVTQCVTKHMGIALQWRTFAAPDGSVTTKIRQGLRTLPELANLFNTLRANGIDPFIVSASMETAVAAFATNPAFGYGMPRENVIGMRLTTKDGMIGTTYEQGWPVTYREGKVVAINDAIRSQPQYCNRGPLIAGGDSDTDYEMLTTYADTKLRIVFNRLFTGDLIAALCRQAVAETPSPRPSVLLQGREENLGSLRLSEASILLGTTSPQLLPASQ